MQATALLRAASGPIELLVQPWGGAEDEQTREEIYPTTEVLQQLKTKRSCELVLLQGWMNVESKQVKVRVNSFPYTEYGEIDGKISRIGADALPPTNLIRTYHFPVDLRLERSTLETRDGTTIPLQAGMTITTNLKLRDKRVISLVSDLLVDQTDSVRSIRQQ